MKALSRPWIAPTDEQSEQALRKAGLWPADVGEQVRAIRRVQWNTHKKHIFRGIGYEAHAEEVWRFHESDARLRIVSAPARTSKSYATAADLVAYVPPAFPVTTQRIALIGINYDTIKEFDYLWDWLVEHKDLVAAGGGRIESAQNSPGQGNLRIVIRWGKKDDEGREARTFVEGKSASNERGLQGEQWDLVVFSEAAEHDSRIWRKYMETRYGRAIFPTTPKPYAGWIRELIRDGERDASLGIEHFTFPRHANPKYDVEGFVQARRRAELRTPSGRAEDDPYFAEQFLGQWVWYTGQVLPFQRLRHVLEPESVDLEGAWVFVSMDYGYDHPSVALLWAVLPNGILAIFDEVYERKLDSYALIERIQGRLDEHGVEASYFTGDPQRPEVAHVLQRLGLPIFTMNKRAQTDRAAGHRRIVDLLTEGPVEGYPGLYVSKRCIRTIQEWEELRYREGVHDEFGATAMIGRDDAYAAARYGVMTLPSPRGEDEPVDWLAEMRRQRKREMRQIERSVPRALRWAATGESPYA